MLRFILKQRVKNDISGVEFERLYTIDVDVPEVERALDSGGYGENGYDRTDLVGVEILRKENEND